MKYFQLSLICLFAFAFSATAQQKAVGKAVISTPTVQCEMCKNKIEKYVLRQYGVSSVNVDYKKKTTTVTWLTDRTNIENVKAAIATAGYDADNVAAEEASYNKLPPCCKKPETEEKSN
ncbi:MAG: cation transporter [Ferruginibacter sp.]